MLPLYLDRLSKERRQVFTRLKAFSDYILAGGTAIKTNSIPIFVLDDLAANKAFTIGRRGVWRDYVDIFLFLKRKKYSIKDLVKLAERKFGGEFSEKLFLGQLTYFDDIKIVPTVFLKEKYKDEEIKSFLEKEVTAYVKSRI